MSISGKSRCEPSFTRPKLASICARERLRDARIGRASGVRRACDGRASRVGARRKRPLRRGRVGERGCAWTLGPAPARGGGCGVLEPAPSELPPPAPCTQLRWPSRGTRVSASSPVHVFELLLRSATPDSPEVAGAAARPRPQPLPVSPQAGYTSGAAFRWR